MVIILRDRTGEIQNEVRYSNPLSITIDRARTLYSHSDIAGNGLRPSDPLLSIRLPDGELATFSALRWEIIFPEVIA